MQRLMTVRRKRKTNTEGRLDNGLVRFSVSEVFSSYQAQKQGHENEQPPPLSSAKKNPDLDASTTAKPIQCSGVYVFVYATEETLFNSFNQTTEWKSGCSNRQSRLTIVS
jgi:hypothetical protein